MSEAIEKVASAIYEALAVSFAEREEPNDDDLVVAARAAIAAMPGWQPIETAPKDGTKVFLWFEWKKPDGLKTFPRGDIYKAAWAYRDDASDGWVDPDGGETIGNEPTHWMPLPTPPEVQS